MNYVVRGANWKIEVEVEETIGDLDYQFAEAATRALEVMYRDDPPVETFDGSKAKIGAAIQVSLFEYDFESANLTGVEIQKKIDNKEVKYMFSPTILANAGKHEVSTYLLSILDTDE